MYSVVCMDVIFIQLYVTKITHLQKQTHKKAKAAIFIGAIDIDSSL